MEEQKKTFFSVDFVASEWLRSKERAEEEADWWEGGGGGGGGRFPLVGRKLGNETR